MKIKKLNQVGDTIIEVMIALVIMGSVLAGAYYLSNYSLNTILESHFRSDALYIAQSQLEQLKVQVNANPSFILDQQHLLPSINSNSTHFCMSNSGGIAWSKSSCYFDTAGVSTESNNYPNFLVSISDLCSNWNQIKVGVSWKQGGRNGQPIINQVDLYYGFNNNQCQNQGNSS
jgi:Tfp pilus assembly protein PilV